MWIASAAFFLYFLVPSSRTPSTGSENGPDTVAGMELAFLPATEQARLVRERQVSPVELVELYLERIERLDPALGAYVTVRGEEALAEARAKAGEPAEAPFHGVPISLKDLETTAGIRTTFSSMRSPRTCPTSTSPTSRG